MVASVYDLLLDWLICNSDDAQRHVFLARLWQINSKVVLIFAFKKKEILEFNGVSKNMMIKKK